MDLRTGTWKSPPFTTLYQSKYLPFRIRSICFLSWSWVIKKTLQYSTEQKKQTCFIKETFSDDAIEKLYFMEEQRSLFLECNLFWRYNSSKDQSWSSVFIEEKKILNDTFLLCKKSEALILNLCFHWREKESASWMKCILPTHKSRK